MGVSHIGGIKNRSYCTNSSGMAAPDRFDSALCSDRKTNPVCPVVPPSCCVKCILSNSRADLRQMGGGGVTETQPGVKTRRRRRRMRQTSGTVAPPVITPWAVVSLTCN